MNIVEINQLHKTYNKGKNNQVHALKGIDFLINQGESLAIMGVSGSGKSTLLNIIGCLDKFDEGEFLFDCKSVKNLGETNLAKLRSDSIGFVLQDYGLLSNETVLENVKKPLLFSSKYKYKEMHARTMQVLHELNIHYLAKKKVKELSGGQKQRVAIARAIVNDPIIILADEPTGALDSATAQNVMEVLMEMNKQGKTVVVVTHDINVANKMARTVNIVDGIIG